MTILLYLGLLATSIFQSLKGSRQYKETAREIDRVSAFLFAFVAGVILFQIVTKQELNTTYQMIYGALIGMNVLSMIVDLKQKQKR